MWYIDKYVISYIHDNADRVHDHNPLMKGNEIKIW